MTNPVLRHCEAIWTARRLGPHISFTTEPTYRQLYDVTAPDLEVVADAAAACIQADIANQRPLVLPAVFADFGTISTARLFGGEVIPPTGGGKVHIHPRFQTVDQLVDLQACPFEESDFQQAITLWQMVCQRVGTDDIYLRTPDFQGPMNTLALVMNQQELMMGMYDAPTTIHTALETITTTLIHYHQRLRSTLGGQRIIGNIWPYTILPEHLGTSITQDMMPLLSPDLYRRFEIPQLQRIAQAFGGLQIHCCGTYAQHLPALKASGLPILGLEFHHPFTPFADIHAHFGDDIVYVPYLFSPCQDYPDYLAFAADLLAQGTPATRFWFACTDTWDQADKLADLLSNHPAST